MEGKDIFVYCEQTDGVVADVGLEMLAPAGRMAEKYSGRVCAILIGADIPEDAVNMLASCGAGTIHVISAPEFAEYSCDAYSAAIVAMCEKYNPAALMIGSTVNGRGLAPRVAARLRTGLTADVTEISYNDELNCINWIMPAYGGQMLASIVCAEKRPQMGTVRPGVFPVVRHSSTDVRIIHEDFRFSPDQIRTRLVKTLAKATGSSNLREANIVVAGGYGCRSKEGFDLVVQLAGALGAAVGASRPAIDAGWAPDDCQIGQSGATVSPSVYVACGISGSIQHTAGMNKSGTVIAINSDPAAPIFDIADIGVVEDLRTFIPCLLAELDKAGGRQ